MKCPYHNWHGVWQTLHTKIMVKSFTFQVVCGECINASHFDTNMEPNSKTKRTKHVKNDMAYLTKMQPVCCHKCTVRTEIVLHVFPAVTWRNNKAIFTPKRRFDVKMTLLLRHVSTGLIHSIRLNKMPVHPFVVTHISIFLWFLWN